MPRSAFLEGARGAGGTKTYSGATAKQKTAVPQGAASLSLAVLESGGRKKGNDRQTSQTDLSEGQETQQRRKDRWCGQEEAVDDGRQGERSESSEESQRLGTALRRSARVGLIFSST